MADTSPAASLAELEADMGCQSHRLSSIGARRSATPARAGYKSLSSRLLAIAVLLAASAVSAHAQSNWTGARDLRLGP